MRLQCDVGLLEEESNNKLDNGCLRSIHTMRRGDGREHSLSVVEGLLPSPVFASDVEGTPNNVGNRSRSGSYSSPKSNLNSNSCVQVAVRVRPLLPFETSNNLQSYEFNTTKSCIHVFGDNSDCDDYNEYYHEDDDVERTGRVHYQNVRVSMPTYPYAQLEEEEDAIESSLPGAEFTFDYVFPNETSQSQFYSTCITPLVHSCLSGYNATVLAYGQTGSGKTFTILGPAPGLNANSNSNASTPLTSPLSETTEKSFDFDAQSVGAVCREDDFDFSKTATVNQNVEVNLQGLPLSRQQVTFDGENVNIASSPTAMATSADDGVLPRALRDLFQSLHQLSHKSQSFTFQVKIQFLELYGENIRDLLALSSSSRKQNHNRNNNALFIRDGAPGNDSEVVGASEFKVSSADEALKYLRMGSKMRVTGKTAMNNESSRSHAIFTLIIHQTNTRNSSFVYPGGGTPNTSTSHKVSRNRLSPRNGDDGAMVETKTSKFHFVDLAGSERTKRSQTRGKRFKEGIEINKGLLALGNVISALGNPKKQRPDSTLSSTSRKSKKSKQQQQHHVPYRDSKLTRLLKGSLGGNHKTLMIACVSPSVRNRDESINTLRYADRAKNIQNKAKVNIDRSTDVNDKLRELQNQVVALAAELLRLRYDDNADEYSCHDDDCDYDDNEEHDEENDSIVRNDKPGDNQFSLKFLESLVNKRDSRSRHCHDRPPLVSHKRRNTSNKKHIRRNHQPVSSVSKGQSTVSSGNASRKVFTFQSIDSNDQDRNPVEGETDHDIDTDTTVEHVLTLNDTFQTENRGCHRKNKASAGEVELADASIYDSSVLEIKKSFAPDGKGTLGKSNSVIIPVNVSAATNVVDYHHGDDSASFDLNSIVIPRYVDGDYDRLSLRSPGGESTKENHQLEEHYRESELYHEKQNREHVHGSLEQISDQLQESYQTDDIQKEKKNAVNERTTPIDLPFDEALNQIPDGSNVIDGCSSDAINTLTHTLFVPREGRHQGDHEQNSTRSISSRLERRYNVRSINEIYNHLEEHRCGEKEEEENHGIHGQDFFHRSHVNYYEDKYDDESSTIKSYLSGSNGQTLEREKLLQKLYLNQERYHVLRMDHELKLQKVTEQIAKYEDEKRNLISLLGLIDEGSYFSTGSSGLKERDMLDIDSDFLSYQQFSEQRGLSVGQTKLGAVQQPSVLSIPSSSSQQRWKDFEAQLRLFRDYIKLGDTQSVTDLQNKKLEENVFNSRIPSVLNFEAKSKSSNKSDIGINSFESFYLKKDRKKTYQEHTAANTDTKASSETKSNFPGISPSNFKNTRHIINSSELYARNEENASETQEEQDLSESVQEEDNGDNCFGSMFINFVRNLFLQKNEGAPLLQANHMRGY